MLDNSWIKRFWNKVSADACALPCAWSSMRASGLCPFPALAQHRQLRKSASQTNLKWNQFFITPLNTLPNPADGADSSSPAMAAFRCAHASCLWAVSARCGQMDRGTVQSTQGKLLCFSSGLLKKGESSLEKIKEKLINLECFIP